MTTIDTVRIMRVLQAAYPRFYAKQTQEQEDDAVTLWAELFADDNFAAVCAAVKALIVSDTEGFPPTIGAVKAKLRELTTPSGITPVEAWALVSAAIKNSAYESSAEYERLPKRIQRLVGHPDQLREWAMMDAATLQSVIGSNFQRSYRALEAQEAAEAAIPADVREFFAQHEKRLNLDGEPERAALPEAEARRKAIYAVSEYAAAHKNGGAA